jgi:hypothetical protein
MHWDAFYGDVMVSFLSHDVGVVDDDPCARLMNSRCCGSPARFAHL